MASDGFMDSMDNWTEVVVDHLYDVDPVFACEALHELDSINHQFPDALRSPSASSAPQPRPLIPGFNTPTSRPPSGPSPIFRTPERTVHNTWTPMRTGGATTNRGIQGDPNTPLPSPQYSNCRCGRGRGCKCGAPQHRQSSFSSPFRRTSPLSPFARSTPIPQSSPRSTPPSSNTIPAWQLPIRAAQNSPSRTMPTLPHESPSLQQWNFPAGELRWSPHPAPHPEIPPAHFWTQYNGLRGLPASARQFPNTPVNASQAAQLTGGWPLPGVAPWWTPNIWPQNVQELTSSPVQLAPCLIPNPADAENAQIVWDLAYDPSGAKGLTPQASINLQAQFTKMATNPAVGEIHIAIHDGLAQRIWGHILIRNQTNKISVWDVLYGIYAYFQAPITQEDLDYLQTVDQANHTILLDAARRRGESSGEMKRIDSLGDQRMFWGLWISNRGQDGWHLNLGLKGP